MNILVPDSWLREYLITEASPKQIKDCLSLCGPSIERLNKVGDDVVYDIEITSNRVDMASVYGIAREANAILPRFNLKTQLKELVVTESINPSDQLLMEITDPENNCDRIMGIVMEVDKMKPSPQYVTDRLEKSGIRSLNNLVDITNYVMLEIGQPTHVFDYDRIKTHNLIIRKAKKNEEIITLDKKKYLLNDQDVIIDDGTGRVIDLPGIMGTENSVVTPETKRILFFIESNNPVLIRRTSLRYGIRTMAATINEKHPDPELVKTALLRGIELFQKLANAKIRSSIIDIYPQKSIISKINVTVDFINSRLGIVLSTDEIVSILKSLTFFVESSDGNLVITPPSFRQFDIKIKEDIVEEVARIYGYHNLPNHLMEGKIPLGQKPVDLFMEEKVKNILKYWGLTEIYNYSMNSQKTTLKIANPLTEDLIYLRSSLLPQMIETIEQNLNFKNMLSLFELSKVYLPRSNELPLEPTRLCIGFYNRSFLELKGLIEGLFLELGIKIDSKQITDNIHIINKTTIIADLDFDFITSNVIFNKKFHSIPLYPALIEDLSFVIPPHTYIGNLIDVIKSQSGLIADVSLLDSYENTRTIRVTYQDPEKTLSEKEIKPIRENILKIAEEKFNAKLKSRGGSES